MTHETKDNNTTGYLLTCMDCGLSFFTEGEKKFYEERKLMTPKRCKKCRNIRKAAFEKEKQEEADRLWREQENKAIEKLLQELPYTQLIQDEVVLDNPERTLFVIGNGFDLMHKVPSSYYDFRDSLGKRSDLRRELETWSLKEDLWADFEDSLAHLDDERMLQSIPDMIDIMGVLDEEDDDFSAADFFAAAEMAVMPLQIIQNDLPRRFRQWVNTLKPLEGYRPLENLIQRDSRYINFNYTEFVESIYGVRKNKIVYIHGDRRKKGKELILGHVPGAEDDPAYERSHPEPGIYNQTSHDMYETAGRYVADYYDATAKKSDEIIKKHSDFFNSLGETETFVVIGHSLSLVDYSYFGKMIQCNGNKANWIIGWHGSGDLKRIRAFVDCMKIRNKQVALLRM